MEFITAEEYSSHLSPSQFETFIFENFNKPDEIWRHAYEQQINDFDRFLLSTLVSFGNSVEISTLEEAFNSRLDYEVGINNYIRPMNAFRKSFRKLLDGFIVLETHDQNICRFINPSLIDFLVSHLGKNRDEVTRIFESASYLSQITTRLFPLDGSGPFGFITEPLRVRLCEKYGLLLNKSQRTGIV